jgi:hypothetical protein
MDERIERLEDLSRFLFVHDLEPVVALNQNDDLDGVQRIEAEPLAEEDLGVTDLIGNDVLQRETLDEKMLHLSSNFLE